MIANVENARIGAIDILVNHAAAYMAKAFQQLSMEEIRHVFELNVMSVIQLTQSFLPTMQERNTGRIINLASEAALKPYVHLLPYSMSKAAIVNFTKGIAERAGCRVKNYG